MTLEVTRARVKLEAQQNTEAASQAKAILSRPDIKQVHSHSKEMTNKIIAAILQEVDKPKSVLGISLRGKEKPSKISVAVLDCEEVVKNTDHANTLQNKFLFKILEEFSKNQNLSDLLQISDQTVSENLLSKVIEFLQKLKEKNRVDQQVILVTNFNSIQEKSVRTEVNTLLQVELSPCRVVIFS